MSFGDKIKNADILLLNNEVSEEVNIAAIKIAKITRITKMQNVSRTAVREVNS